MISDNTAEVPDAKKPRLEDLPPPPPVPPAVPPVPPPPAPFVQNGSYGTQDLIAQMTARGVAKAPGGGPPGPGNMGPLGPSNVGGMLRPMMPAMAHPQMPMMQACRPMVPQPHACMLPLPGPPATGKPIFLAAATVPYRWADLGGGMGTWSFRPPGQVFPSWRRLVCSTCFSGFTWRMLQYRPTKSILLNIPSTLTCPRIWVGTLKKRWFFF